MLLMYCTEPNNLKPFEFEVLNTITAIKQVMTLSERKHTTGNFLLMDSEAYPRVKVRQQEQEDDGILPPNENGALQSTRVAESSFPEKENQCNSPPSVARIRKPNVLNLRAEPAPASEGNTSSSRQLAENKKLNAKACSSVLRPRAVLSSPDNDGIIGKRNKLNYGKSLAFRSCNHELKVAVQTKVIASRDKEESPLNTKKKGFKYASKNASSFKKEGLKGIGSSSTKSITKSKREGNGFP